MPARRFVVVLVGLVVAVAALAGCAGTPACPLPPPQPPGPPFLWKVQREGGPVVWLYGTYHHAGGDAVAPAVWTALEGAPRFVSELGDAEPDGERFREHARLRYGEKGLDFQLPQDDWWELRDALRGVMREDELRRLKPWYAMSLLTRTMAPSASPTMDDALTARAQARGLPVEALETWDEQLPVLAAGVTIADLREAIAARKTMRCDLAAVDAAYTTGDLAVMHVRLNVDGSARFLTERNAAWLPVIERHLADGGAFVAVGLSHLSGDGGLPALLAARGYTVARVE